MRILLTTALTIVLLTSTPTLAQTSKASEPWSQLTDVEKLYGLSFFWMEATYNFAYFHQVPELDWDSAYQAFIPQVLETENVYEYYRVLQRFASLLKDGHTSVGMPRHVQDSISYPKLRLQEFERLPVIVNVDRSLARDLPIGSRVLSVDGVPVQEYLQSEVLPYVASSTEHVLWDFGAKVMLRGWIDTEVTLRVQRPDGSEYETTLVRNRKGVEWVRPVDNNESPVRYRGLDGDLAYVAIKHFNSDSIVTLFEELLPRLYTARGVVLDLRGNGGGNTSNGTAILGYFTDRILIGSRWATPQTIAAHRAWGVHAFENGATPEENEYVRHFLHQSWFVEDDPWSYEPAAGEKITAPVAVLIDRGTVSAAEDFLIFADSLEQFTYIGEPTNGSTGQPLFCRDAPGGGSWRICTKRDTYPDGRDFVGYGIQPDIRVTVSVDDYLAERDPVLDTAVAHLMRARD